MVPTTSHLISYPENESQFLPLLRNALPATELLFAAKLHRWIHGPHLSVNNLIGTGKSLIHWKYLLVTKTPDLPDRLISKLSNHWSVTAEVSDDLLASLGSTKQSYEDAAPPELPPGWSATNHSGLDAAEAPPDLEASVAMTARELSSERSSSSCELSYFVRRFGSHHTGPVAMFNLLSYLPGQRERYFQYIAAFQQSVGIKYGGAPLFAGFGVQDWSSRVEDEEPKQEGGWEDVALVRYPSFWHFTKMLDDPKYAEADRKYKQGVLRDNPLLCCTELKVF
ncbi:hypothetical protein B9Z65_2049 [Elsinoe australis]|uniref:DUF1330 domain-containing protein n=1 Tax=Elsinoe australis TaxID=40998 RepID=A0A2P7YMW2_9PEZI|nr:hypothetical protein B9Z65_2049 [Elsinoe australis]